MAREEAAESEEKQQGLNGIERALDVLALFINSDSPTLGVTEIASELALSKAVVHRLLTTFRVRGFVEIDPETHRYQLGPEIGILGLSYLDRIDLRSLGHQVLVKLVALTNETATMSVRVGSTRVYLDQVTPHRDVKMMVQLGRPFPLHAGASSKALLAFLPEAEREEYLASQHLTALTPRTLTDPVRLRQELTSIRQAGYAVSFGERDASAGSVAAPVFDHTGHPAGVISVSGPVERFSAVVTQASSSLLQATRELSRRLGYRASDQRGGGGSRPLTPELPGSRVAADRALQVTPVRGPRHLAVGQHLPAAHEGIGDASRQLEALEGGVLLGRE
jgi:IclR family acetate operon transcriptional repressor